MLYIIILSILALLAYIGYALPFYKEKIQNTESIPDSDLEDVYIKAKEIAIQTSPYEQERKYESAYYRCRNILQSILIRHESHILNALAKSQVNFQIYLDASKDQEIRINLRNLDQYDDDFLFAASLIYFNGWFVPGQGLIHENKEVCFTLADYLIEEKEYGKACLIKGIAFKYGIKVFCKPNIEEAKVYLTKAIDFGAGTAIKELQQLNKHKHLQNLKYNHIVNETWESVSSYNAIKK